MQDLEHNMDDLFRKAADEYPLQMDDSRWNDVAGKLSNVKIETTAFRKKNNLKQGRRLFVFLLIFLIAGGTLVKFTETEKRISGGMESVGTAVENISVKETRNLKKGFVAVHQTPKNGSSGSLNVDKLKKNIRLNTSSQPPGGIGSLNLVLNTTESDESKKKLVDYSERSTKVSNNDPDSATSNIISKDVFNGLQKVEEIKPVKNTDQKEILAPHVNSTDQRIYFGLSFGPSFSKIKSGELHRIGYDISILAGYKLNNKVSIESGLLFARKYYSSDGKYFSMDKVRSSMPSGMEVLNLEGSSSVFEIPLRIKYDLFQIHTATLFSTAGISSGIMTNERNNYRTSMNGAEQNLAGSYNRVSAYFANSLDISFGYENKIGKIGSVRVEPYMKIPLKGTGVGALPVVSTGLHIAFTRFSH